MSERERDRGMEGGREKEGGIERGREGEREREREGERAVGARQMLEEVVLLLFFVFKRSLLQGWPIVVSVEGPSRRRRPSRASGLPLLLCYFRAADDARQMLEEVQRVRG